MIPIKIETLLQGRKVERNRIEYKAGFNPEDIVHTICAYANDIASVDGGYLVIGVKSEDGIPILPPIGLPNEELDNIQLKLFEYCNKIEPRYIPKIDVVEYQGANLLYLKCAAGDAGPYQAPVDVYSKKESEKEANRTMKYWIRPASLTVEAKQSEIAELFEKFTSIPFVDRINSRATMEQIRRGYLEDFIRESNSSLIEELNVRSLEDLLVSEEVAEEKDEEKVVKVDGRAEADRFFNYPYNALEEAIVNAVLHKNYKEDVPVEIRIYVDQIQIINFPGPEHYIDMEKFASGKVRARRYRNPKIGEFFKEIDLSEKKSTGISKILRELERNGSPLPEFETDADRTYMITTVKIHKGFRVNTENFDQKNDRSLTEVLTEVLTKRNYDKLLPIIKYLDKNGKITPQAAEAITQKSKSTTYRYLSMLAETGYIEVSGNTNNTIYKVCKL